MTAELVKVGSRDGDRLLLSATDLSVRAVEAWKEACDVLQQAVYPMKLNMQEMQGRFGRISQMLGTGKARAVGGQVTVGQWKLLEALGSGRSDRRTPVHFGGSPGDVPKGLRQGHLGVVLSTGSRVEKMMDDSSDVVSQLLDFYPGPQFEVPAEPEPTMARGLRKDPEGSVHSQGSFDRVSQLEI